MKASSTRSALAASSVVRGTGGPPPGEGVSVEAGAGRVRVRVWEEAVVLPTWRPARPDRNPMFLEKRVYQGSSGRVYPLPFTDRIEEQPVDRAWQGVWLENEHLRVLVLPEIGGRIHAVEDRATGYDLVYRQPVIKPALVGLAGPWISGGIEFNWPQHHRPATFLPVEWRVEVGPDGSCTVWCGDHDPMSRMRGLHGVCLHPGRAVLELKVRAYNRTPHVQTFLWWANVATRVHEAYQSFFPPDVESVADHAKRATASYPLCHGRYYGVDYGRRSGRGVPEGQRPTRYVPSWARQEDGGGTGAGSAAGPDYAPNDLSFYANIPVPTSYMAVGSKQDFFGGYDHRAEAGIVHVANRHVAPGKKQWTWGNHPFGYAWDRHLTAATASGEHPPYIELMAGVYTDNQPDFGFLQPGETKTWSQYWYPIHRIGPAQAANVEAAVSVRVGEPKGRPGRAAIRVGVAVTRALPGARVELARTDTGRVFRTHRLDLAPAAPWVGDVRLPPGVSGAAVEVRVRTGDGRDVIRYRPAAEGQGKQPEPATEPPPPEAVGGTDELYVTGLHLAQYRHATRCPTAYWREALRRDPLDARCNTALGRWHLERGEFPEAERHLRRAIERLTRRNPNPADGEAHYHLGLVLRYRLDALPPEEAAGAAGDGLFEGAYEAFYKATWNQGWAGASYHALAELDCRRGDWAAALEHVERALRFDTENLRALNLRALIERKCESGRVAGSEGGGDWRDRLEAVRVRDPLDAWARHLAGEPVTADLGVRLDVAHDYARAGFLAEAIALLEAARPAQRDLPDGSWGAEPLVAYTLGWLWERVGRPAAARRSYRRAARLSPDYCFPARLEEIAILEAACRADPNDPRAAYYLGNLLYDRRRHEEAIRWWERSARLDPGNAVVWRNLGLGYFNIRGRVTAARRAYDRAVRADPGDARLRYERDQLWKRTGVSPRRRLRELERHLEAVRRRDDASVELCALYTRMGRAGEALALLGSRRFQPWEGGEGQALGQHVRAHLTLGKAALRRGEPAAAREHFEAALGAPENLGEARHLLANQSDLHHLLGVACEGLGDRAAARRHWRTAATFRGDFQDMRVRAYSEMTYYSALAWGRLGRRDRMIALLRGLLGFARQLATAPATIDYFATSLPTMLLFEDDLAARQRTTALFLEAQARLGLGQRTRGRARLREVLRRDPNHALAADLLDDLAAWDRGGQRRRS